MLYRYYCVSLDDKKSKEGVTQNEEKYFLEDIICDTEHNIKKGDKIAQKNVKENGKQNFLEKKILDSEYNIKKEVHEIFKGYINILPSLFFL